MYHEHRETLDHFAKMVAAIQPHRACPRGRRNGGRDRSGVSGGIRASPRKRFSPPMPTSFQLVYNNIVLSRYGTCACVVASGHHTPFKRYVV